MSNIVLLLNILLVTTCAMYAMDDPNQTRKKKSLPRLPLSRMDSKKNIPKVIPQIPLATVQNDYSRLPDISITDPIAEDIGLQKTLSQLLALDKEDTSVQLSRNRMVPGKNTAKIETNLQKPLLPKQEIKTNPRKLVLALDKTASLSGGDSPATSPSTSPRTSSPRKKASFLRKRSSSSSYNSPRDSSGSHDNSPHEITTYEDVVAALNSKSKKISKRIAGFLENPNSDPNQQDKITGLTILHRTVLLHNEKATDLLLRNPKTDTSIEVNSRKASDFIKDEIIKYEKLFNTLKRREFVDLIIDALMITNTLLQNPHCPQEFMREVINTFLERTLPKTLPEYTDSDFFIAAIRYRQTDKPSLLKDFHKQFKKNPNYQDKLGNTMWHYAAIALDEVLIARLASNPYLDSSIRNNENCIAVQLIPSSSNIKTKHLTDAVILKIQYLKHLRTFFFTREVLELSSSKQAQTLRAFMCSSDINSLTTEINPEDLASAKKLMLKDFDEIAHKQGDSALPEATQFPSYATDEFTHLILKRNLEKINQQGDASYIKPTSQVDLENLLKVLAQEYELILSGQIKLKYIVIEKKLEQQEEQDVISKPIPDQDPLVSKSSED